MKKGREKKSNEGSDVSWNLVQVAPNFQNKLHYVYYLVMLCNVVMWRVAILRAAH